MANFGNIQSYDHSFSMETLAKMLRKSDFFNNRDLHKEEFKLSLINEAVNSAHSLFSGKNPLRQLPNQGKPIYRINSLTNELVMRKLRENIAWLVSIRPPCRTDIISNLRRLIGEGVPYRLYRLDIKKFYESFSTEAVEKQLIGLPGLSPPSKALIKSLLLHYTSSGGTGIPRGLALSAMIAEVMMQNFDLAVRSKPWVYFFSRYVDDIVILTSSEENPRLFEKEIISKLPEGLRLHERKRQICSISDSVSPITNSSSPTTAKICFDYLGYAFSVCEPEKEPNKPNKRKGKYFRKVVIDISHSKIRKIKTRIIQSLLDFATTGNFNLLHLRIKFLTSNFSVNDFSRDRSKLAGIYYAYPEITEPDKSGLFDLDKFLLIAALSKNGRVFSKLTTMLKPNQRRLLLKHSFVRAHKNRTMVHFHPSTIKKIQECWKNE